jgi:chemotaxis protein MotB
MSKKARAGAPTWMVTFADMMSLLLALFVLLLSFAEMDVIRYKQMAGAMREAFGVHKETRLAGVVEIDGSPHKDHARVVLPVPQPEASERPGREDPEPGELTEPVREAMANEIARALIDVEESEGDVVIRLQDRAAFGSGSEALTDTFLPTLEKLGEILADTEGDILVAGHTDDVPISAGRFRSNWDLSTARAVSVVHYLLANTPIDRGRLTAQGYGDSRPLVPNDSEEGRAANRRVEITVRKRPSD